MTHLAQTAFDYESLDAETRIVVRQKTGEIKDRMRRSASDIVEIGERLIGKRPANRIFNRDGGMVTMPA